MAWCALLKAIDILYTGPFYFFIPRNPMGRTGMSGRGLLGRFGPNHAADPIVTRYLRLEDWCFAVNILV